MRHQMLQLHMLGMEFVQNLIWATAFRKTQSFHFQSLPGPRFWTNSDSFYALFLFIYVKNKVLRTTIVKDEIKKSEIERVEAEIEICQAKKLLRRMLLRLKIVSNKALPGVDGLCFEQAGQKALRIIQIFYKRYKIEFERTALKVFRELKFYTLARMSGTWWTNSGWAC